MTQSKKLKRLVRARAARTGESYSTSLRHLRARNPEESPMTDAQTQETPLAECSFCSKPQDQVAKLIFASGVSICDECVELCMEIITEEQGQPKSSADEIANAWSAMLKTKGEAARSAEEGLAKLVRQARAKAVPWADIATSLGISAEEAEARYGA